MSRIRLGEDGHWELAWRQVPEALGKAEMDLEDVLAVLLGWLGREVTVTAGGAAGADPANALDPEGVLRRGETFGTESTAPARSSSSSRASAASRSAPSAYPRRASSAAAGSTRPRKCLRLRSASSSS